MATKKNRRVAKREHRPITKEMWLEQLIEISERSVTSQNTSIDELFRNQAKRLGEELEQLKRGKK
jgi:hypothetical protein